MSIENERAQLQVGLVRAILRHNLDRLVPEAAWSDPHIWRVVSPRYTHVSDKYDIFKAAHAEAKKIRVQESTESPTTGMEPVAAA